MACFMALNILDDGVMSVCKIYTFEMIKIDT
jgi:hypothetical protein